ncbi:MAG TPA: AzlD domain-containing protein [Burkholderiales bacterium]|jgi:branched-subunit amino acid transport protein|nr:AzlD domain-containing protein [Burkholderiales bacterium]
MTELWMALLAGGALTFLSRLSFISLLAGREIPPLAMQALRFVPPAVLSAIVFPELLMRNGTLDAAPDNPRLIAGCIAIFVAWKFRRILPTIAAGMVSLWLLLSLA